MNTFCQTAQQLAKQVEALATGAVLIIGDTMLDVYLTGSANRISPEAPVPIVQIKNERHLLGGAGNVAKNITALQGKAYLVGVKGDDTSGALLENALSSCGIETSLLFLKDRPTTVKTRIMAQNQQVIRFDREDATPHTPDVSDGLLQKAAEYLPEVQSIILSDYGKGLITKTFMDGLHALLAQDGRHVPVLVDPKPVNTHLYSNVTLMTPNAKETAEAAHLPVDTPEHIKAAGKKLMSSLNLQYLLTTLGADGMAVFSPDNVWHIPTTAQHVFDVTGAGDTVIATTALALSAGQTLIDACMLANYAAGIVVGEVGAATASPGALKNAIRQLPFIPPVEW